MPPAVIDQEYWTMYFDGSLMNKGTGVGLVFDLVLRVHMRYMVRIHFPSSNNVAEYEALINGLLINLSSSWSSTKSQMNQAATMPTWLRIAEKSTSCRTSSMVLSSITF